MQFSHNWRLRAKAFSLIIAAIFAVAEIVYAAPYDAGLAAKIDTYLTGKGSPIAGNGAAFFSNGVNWNVDPRLVVAIAGNESTFGKNYASCLASGFNAWSYFFNGNCQNSNYSSYAAGIANVTHEMRRYFDRGYTSIPLIAAHYCAAGCANWVPNVTIFYTEQGGDTTDLTFRGEQVADFEAFSGPSLFGSAQPPLVSALATFSGGEVLSGATFLPADASKVYGTASICSGCLKTISIKFSQNVSNVSLWVLNGETTTMNYTVTDSAGDTQTVSLAANSSSGFTTVFLPMKNVVQVSVTNDGSSTFDFLIDNVRYTPT